MSNVSGASHFVTWEGGCLVISRSTGAPGEAIVPEHAHYAIQVAFGPEPGIRFRCSTHDEWTSYAGAVIPSRQPHAMNVTGMRACAVLFIEPETREGRAIAERWLQGGIAALPADVVSRVAPALFEAWEIRRDAAAVREACREVVRALTGDLEPMAPADERILRATAYIRDHLDRPLTLEEVAAEACLSPSRFRHLFVEQTGMALRPYILWRRFLRVWELLMQGVTLSAAAHAAGFADAAHLSRTSRRTFGFPPSAMPMGAPLRDGGVAAPATGYPGPTGQPLRSRV